MPGERLELSLCCQNRILSPARLPIPPSRPERASVAYHYGSESITVSGTRCLDLNDLFQFVQTGHI